MQTETARHRRRALYCLDVGPRSICMLLRHSRRRFDTPSAPTWLPAWSHRDLYRHSHSAPSLVLTALSCRIRHVMQGGPRADRQAGELLAHTHQAAQRSVKANADLALPQMRRDLHTSSLRARSRLRWDSRGVAALSAWGSLMFEMPGLTVRDVTRGCARRRMGPLAGTPLRRRERLSSCCRPAPASCLKRSHPTGRAAVTQRQHKSALVSAVVDRPKGVGVQLLQGSAWLG